MVRFLKQAYEEFWVPFLGRLLTMFSTWIEGEPPKQKPTFNLRTKENE